MKLMTLKEWADETFTEASRPDIRTLHRWIRDGHLAVRVIGRNYYVDAKNGLQENNTVKKARLKLISER
jgi:hypothetical protein